jgi:arylamine N-acetyltransferase
MVGKWMSQLQMLPIQVIPATIDFLKAADLVEAMAIAINFEARDKLNDTRPSIGPTSFCRADT